MGLSEEHNIFSFDSTLIFFCCSTYHQEKLNFAVVVFDINLQNPVWHWVFRHKTTQHLMIFQGSTFDFRKRLNAFQELSFYVFACLFIKHLPVDFFINKLFFQSFNLYVRMLNLICKWYRILLIISIELIISCCRLLFFYFGRIFFWLNI